MKALKQFFKNRETFVGIATAISFLLIFFCVWMTAYDGVTERAGELRIGFVNEDVQLGETIEKTLLNDVPFNLKAYQSIETAKEDMNKRQLDMVMLIPKEFSEQIQTNGETELEYFINQANTSLAKQIMDGTAKNMTQVINENVYKYIQQIMLQQGAAQLSSFIPSNELILSVSNNMTQMVQSLDNSPVKSSIQKTNNTDGFSVTMVPMMIVLASFVGSMIMSMNINLVAMKLRNTLGKWSILLARQIINLGAAIFLAIITMILFELFNISLNTTIFQTWLFQTIVFFAFLSLTQMFVIIFGTGGMIFNIILLSMQLVTSGVIVPKVMLSNFYQTIGSYLPATYAVNGYFTIIFGGESLDTDISILLIISAVTLLIAVAKIAFQRQVADNMNEVENTIVLN